MKRPDAPCEMRGGQTALGLRGALILVDQPAESVAAVDLIDFASAGDRFLFAWRHVAEGRTLRECAVWPVRVVVLRVRLEDLVEVTASEDQDPVEAFAADAADPAFGVRPCFRRPHRRFDHANAIGAEDLVELACELAVAVADQNPRTTEAVVVELHQQVGAC